MVSAGKMGCNASQTGTAIRNTWGSCSATELGPVPRISDPVGVVWDRRVCASLQFPGDAAAAGPGTTGQNHRSEAKSFNQIARQRLRTF